MVVVNTDKLRDAIYGAAVGDALGVPYEFGWRGNFECVDMVGYGTHNQPAGTWSDDTSMLLATCDSLRAKRGRVDVKDMRQRFENWCFKGAYTPHGVVFDVGNATQTALYEGVGCKSEQNNGNGSLMRIIPLAFTNATDDEITEVSAITHAHRVSTEACVMYVHIVRDVLAGVSLKEAVARNVNGAHPFERLAVIGELPEEEIESSGYVVHTLEAALWCLLNTNSYEECVLKAVNLGHDTDTTACVAGALAGIIYGYNAIPARWIDGLCAKEIIDTYIRF